MNHLLLTALDEKRQKAHPIVTSLFAVVVLAVTMHFFQLFCFDRWFLFSQSTGLLSLLCFTFALFLFVITFTFNSLLHLPHKKREPPTKCTTICNAINWEGVWEQQQRGRLDGLCRHRWLCCFYCFMPTLNRCFRTRFMLCLYVWSFALFAFLFFADWPQRITFISN